MPHVFAGISSEQAKCGVFSQKFRLDKQNAARFHGNSSWANKTSRVFTEISFGQAKRGAFSRKFHFGKQNAAHFYGNFVWTSKTSHVFMEIPLGQAKRRAFSQKFRLGKENGAWKCLLSAWWTISTCRESQNLLSGQNLFAFSRKCTPQMGAVSIDGVASNRFSK